MKFLQLLCGCVRYCDGWDTWHQDVLRQKARGDSLHAEWACAALQDDGGEGQRRLELFKPAFSQLVALICGRVRYPDDWDTWHRDDRDEFRQQRYSVADTLLDAAGEGSLP